MAKKSGKSFEFNLALVGGDTLLGKEIGEVVESKLPAANISTFAASGEGNFGEQEGEAIYLQPLETATLLAVKAILFAGSDVGASKSYDLAKSQNGQTVLVDCTGLLRDKPEARTVAPLVSGDVLPDSWLLVLAHPMASALALVLRRLTGLAPLRRSIAHIFEPASERGQRGITELHGQTTNLLAFKSLDKQVFDAQLSFNLLPHYGDEAPLKLSSVEQQIEKDLASVLGSLSGNTELPLPSVRVIQAPVFHGYSASLWIEFEASVSPIEIGQALASAQIEVRGSGEEAPTNVGAASQSGLTIGDIRTDSNNARAVWLWLVADNLRLRADSVGDLLIRLEDRLQ